MSALPTTFSPLVRTSPQDVRAILEKGVRRPQKPGEPSPSTTSVDSSILLPPLPLSLCGPPLTEVSVPGVCQANPAPPEQYPRRLVPSTAPLDGAFELAPQSIFTQCQGQAPPTVSLRQLVDHLPKSSDANEWDRFFKIDGAREVFLSLLHSSATLAGPGTRGHGQLPLFELNSFFRIDSSYPSLRFPLPRRSLPFSSLFPVWLFQSPILPSMPLLSLPPFVVFAQKATCQIVHRNKR